MTIVARGIEALEAVGARLGAATIAADVTDEDSAYRTLGELHADIMVLNAGATPRMGRPDDLTWEDFSVSGDLDGANSTAPCFPS